MVEGEGVEWERGGQFPSTFDSVYATILMQVLDARNTVTTQEMYDAICHHIEYGTNGGNMR